MVTLQKHKWPAALLSILLMGALVLWVVSSQQKQTEAGVSFTANWSLALTELVIDETVASLEELAARGVDSCQPSHLELLRQAVFASGSIRELAVIGPQGQTLCTEIGSSFVGRDVLASAATSNPDIMLDVVRIADTDERMLRVRRLMPRGVPGLAALLRTDPLLPRVSPEGGLFSGYARMTLADGTLVGSSGIEITEGAGRDDRIISRMRSGRYGPVINVTTPDHGSIAKSGDLRRIGIAAGVLVVCAILIYLVVIPARESSNSNSELGRALLAGEFVPFYQPIVDITSGRLLGAEVLVRWRKPDGTIVLPNAFIPMVESSGLILALTRSLMRQACEEVGPTLESRPEMYLGFNVAPLHFKDAAILNDVGIIFEGSPIRLTQVVLEVTERYELESLSATRRVIAALQALGCKVALDDVGAGHSGLSYILKLGVDIIKIDKLFVEAIETEPHTQAIVGTLVDLARNMRMKIVAEGVENFEQVISLREHGISAAQGFVFAQPLPGAAFVQLVEAVNARPAKDAEEVAGVAQDFGSAVDQVAA